MDSKITDSKNIDSAKFMYFLYITIVVMLINVYFFHTGLINYITQRFHYEISISNNNDFFKISNIVTNKIEKLRILLFGNEIDQMSKTQEIKDNNLKSEESGLDLEKKSEFTQKGLDNNDVSKTSKSDDALSPQNQVFTDPKSHAPIIVSESSQQKPSAKITNNKLITKSGANVLIIGDSMMQGIAFGLNHSLKQKGFKVTNLARASTGLLSLKNFNWIATTENMLRQNPKISIIIATFGTNDSWNIGNNKFGTEGWIRIYKKRVQEILNIAKANNATVVWYEIPAVKNETLNKKLQFINGIFKNVMRENNALFIPADDILVDSKFSFYVKNAKGKSVLARASDGIHFSTQGALIMTKSLMDRLVIESDSNDSNSKGSDFQGSNSAN